MYIPNTITPTNDRDLILNRKHHSARSQLLRILAAVDCVSRVWIVGHFSRITDGFLEHSGSQNVFVMDTFAAMEQYIYCVSCFCGRGSILLLHRTYVFMWRPQNDAIGGGGQPASVKIG